MGQVAAPYILMAGFFFFFLKSTQFSIFVIFSLFVFFSKMNCQECLNNFEILGAIYVQCERKQSSILK